MAWSPLDQTLWAHRKTIHLSILLGIDDTYAAAHMARLWSWCLDNAPDGNLTGLHDKVISLAAGWKGDAELFVASIVKSGFVERLDSGLVVHDWYEYTGKLIDKRAEDAHRKRINRQKYRGQKNDVQRMSDGRHADVEGNSNSNSTVTEPKDTTATTTRADERNPETDPDKAFITVHEAYCELHKQLQASSNDVLAIQRTIAGGIPFPFIVKAMRESFAAKQAREKERFRKPRAFSYYEDAIREAWEKELLIRNGGGQGGGLQTGNQSGGRRGTHSPNARTGSGLSVTDDELDGILANQSAN